ncbi:MAG: 1,4-dihydroxy-2-naphthoate polyprenyltransferase [Candidatus Eremiobacteraeota bacterium]|jgi:1,4-dihydroxy-2-naphthoate octaprenyltransferase|nr:1,4-dihydroxy-2-naphthoate polyprenyltransferase [Candidatus Eremiobacteraeota bacterium]
MTAILAFVRLSRPLFLYGGFAGVALGAAVAHSSGFRIDVATYLWAQALVTAFQLMVHYANDYFDRAADTHATRTAWSGGSGILSTGALAPGVALGAALACAVLGLLVTAHFALAGNATVGWLGVTIGVLAWCYSAPPIRLAARGLGELDTAVVVAVLVPCTGFAAFAGRLGEPLSGVVTSTALAMFAMMLCVELPDAGADFGAGKRNLVVHLGPSRVWQLITLASVIAVAHAFVLGYRVEAGPWLLVLAPAAAAAVGLARQLRSDPRPASVARWGVGLYATTVTGLAALYAALGTR